MGNCLYPKSRDSSEYSNPKQEFSKSETKETSDAEVRWHLSQSHLDEQPRCHEKTNLFQQRQGNANWNRIPVDMLILLCSFCSFCELVCMVSLNRHYAELLNKENDCWSHIEYTKDFVPKSKQSFFGHITNANVLLHQLVAKCSLFTKLSKIRFSSQNNHHEYRDQLQFLSHVTEFHIVSQSASMTEEDWDLFVSPVGNSFSRNLRLFHTEDGNKFLIRHMMALTPKHFPNLKEFYLTIPREIDHSLFTSVVTLRQIEKLSLMSGLPASKSPPTTVQFYEPLVQPIFHQLKQFETNFKLTPEIIQLFSQIPNLHLIVHLWTVKRSNMEEELDENNNDNLLRNSQPEVFPERTEQLLEACVQLNQMSGHSVEIQLDSINHFSNLQLVVQHASALISKCTLTIPISSIQESKQYWQTLSECQRLTVLDVTLKRGSITIEEIQCLNPLYKQLTELRFHDVDQISIEKLVVMSKELSQMPKLVNKNSGFRNSSVDFRF